MAPVVSWCLSAVLIFCLSSHCILWYETSAFFVKLETIRYTYITCMCIGLERVCISGVGSSSSCAEEERHKRIHYYSSSVRDVHVLTWIIILFLCPCDKREERRRKESLCRSSSSRSNNLSGFKKKSKTSQSQHEEGERDLRK